MPERVGLRHTAIVPLGNDLSASDDHGTHWDIPSDKGTTSLFQSKEHETLVGGVSPNGQVRGARYHIFLLCAATFHHL